MSRLLFCGAVAGPLWLVVVLIQDYTRPDFDPRLHVVSLLSLTGLGWIHITNCVLAGLLNVAYAVGLRRLLHPGPGGTWGPILIGAYGVGLVGAGVFPPDPMYGFPPGAPPGLPAAVSTTMILHGLSFAFVFLPQVAAAGVFTRAFFKAGDRPWALYSLAVAVALPILYALAGILSDRGVHATPLSLTLRAMAVVGWTWASFVAVRLRPAGLGAPEHRRFPDGMRAAVPGPPARDGDAPAR